MGYRVEVVRRPVKPELTRSERRSWRLHRTLSRRLDERTLRQWRPTIRKNLTRLRGAVQASRTSAMCGGWGTLVSSGDLGGLHRALTGLDRDSIEMREVSPMGGLLSERERTEAQAG